MGRDAIHRLLDAGEIRLQAAQPLQDHHRAGDGHADPDNGGGQRGDIQGLQAAHHVLHDIKATLDLLVLHDVVDASGGIQRPAAERQTGIDQSAENPGLLQMTDDPSGVLLFRIAPYRATSPTATAAWNLAGTTKGTAAAKIMSTVPAWYPWPGRAAAGSVARMRPGRHPRPKGSPECVSGHPSGTDACAACRS